MQVILLERVPKLGQMGDVVNVKNGYARNFLFPQGKAVRSSEANLADFEARRSELEAKNLELKEEAESVAAKLMDREFVLIRSASDVGSLYGSVTTRDIAETASGEAVSISRQQIELERPIKTLGLHDVTAILHPEVSVAVKVNVARTHEEAALQARGEDVLGKPDEEAEDTAKSPIPEADHQVESAETVSEGAIKDHSESPDNPTENQEVKTSDGKGVAETKENPSDADAKTSEVKAETERA